MTTDEITKIVLEEIANVAPDANLEGIDPDEDLRDAVDLDSMDMLNIITALHERLNIDIPEADAGQFVTLAGAVHYVNSQLAKS